MSIKEKIETIVREMYGGSGVEYSPEAEKKIERLHAPGLRQAADLHGEDASEPESRSESERRAHRLHRAGAGCSGQRRRRVSSIRCWARWHHAWACRLVRAITISISTWKPAALSACRRRWKRRSGTARWLTFARRSGGTEPVPAGVAISAVTASLALALSGEGAPNHGREKSFAGDPQEIETLYEAARRASTELTHKADEDVRAFNRYLECMREPENPGREQAMTAAMEEATRVPLDAARLTIGGLGLCLSHSAGLCEQGMTASDLGMARSVLSGAARAMLLSVESNLQAPPVRNEPFHNEISAELQELKNKLRTLVKSGISGT